MDRTPSVAPELTFGRAPGDVPTLVSLRGGRARLAAPPVEVVPQRRPVADLEIAIPAFNEAGRLPQTLALTVEFLREQPWSSRVVVVDNGSSDSTADVVRQHIRRSDGAVPVDLVGCARPGKGAAVRRALLGSRSRYVGFFDADLATPLATLVDVMRHLDAGAAAVIGSRHAAGATFVQAQPRTRRLGGAAFRLATRSLVRDVADTQCGFKFFDRTAVVPALVSCRTDDFAFDVELLRHVQDLGLDIVEIPVAWTDGTGSSFSPVRDGISAFRAILPLLRAAAGTRS